VFVDLLLAVEKIKKNQMNTKFKTVNVRKIKKEPITINCAQHFLVPLCARAARGTKKKVTEKLKKRANYRTKFTPVQK